MVHELVHIVHGHLDYLERKLKAKGVIAALKAKRDRGPIAGSVERQAIELWADHKAIAVNLGGFLTTPLYPPLRNVFSGPEDKVFIWCFAMHTLFRIWGLQTDMSALAEDHPPEALRFQIDMLGASMVTSSKFPSLGDVEFSRAMRKGILESEKAITYCGGKRLLPEDVAGLNDPRMAAHRTLLIDYFDEILRPELPAHSYIELNEPAG
jgi:hypothetical protein